MFKKIITYDDEDEIEIWVIVCYWCGRGVREDDLTETLDGSKLCSSCIVHYMRNEDAEDGPYVQFISNIDRE